MDPKEEFREGVRAFGRAGQDPPAPHLSDDQMIDYRQGRLEEAERERAQSHLVQCEICLTEYKAMGHLFSSEASEQMPVSQAEARREWRAYWQRIQSEERARVGRPSPKEAGSWLGRRAGWALAGSLMLAVMLTGAWALRQRQETRRLAGQLQAVQGVAQERLGQLEQARHLQAQTDAAKKAYESQLADLRRPQLNIPVFSNIISQEFIRRTGGSRAAVRLTVGPIHRQFTLILNGEGQATYPDYGIEIVDAQGQFIWRGEGLRRDPNGNFIMLLDRAFLSNGEYHLKLYGRREGRSQPIAKYIIILHAL